MESEVGNGENKRALRSKFKQESLKVLSFPMAQSTSLMFNSPPPLGALSVRLIAWWSALLLALLPSIRLTSRAGWDWS